MEIIDQNLGANFGAGNSAGDSDLPGYNKTDEEGVYCSRKPPTHRFCERAAMGLAKATHQTPHRSMLMSFNGRKMEVQRLAYVYFEEEPGRQQAAKLLSRDEARRIAANVAMSSTL
jgi:hypothetical protein